MRIYLVGYMYSGKSTVGRQLAHRLGLRFIDTDSLFEERYHTTIPLFFHRYDEVAFRRLEQQVLHSTALMDNVVVATGGGTPCYADNMDWINLHGVSVHLDASLSCLLERAGRSRHARPLLAEMEAAEREAYMRRQLEERMPVYTRALLRLEADNPDIQDFVKALDARGQNVTKT
ncbi:MAG: shikimate kinase [Bacteroidales bacterium]|nr:shikimate kinase [Bacteroidales bacterium]